MNKHFKSIVLVTATLFIASLSMNAEIISIASADQFNQITQSKPTIARFYGSWCGACKAMEKIFKNLEQQHGSEITFLNVDVDKNSDLASHYGVTGVPTFIFFKDGNQIESMVGETSQADFEQKINNVFKK